MLLATYNDVSMLDAGTQVFPSAEISISEDYNQAKTIFQNAMIYFFFFNIFIMALGAKFAFRKEQYNLFELYVIFLLLNGHLSFLSIGLIAIGQFNNMAAQISLIIIGILYPAIVLARIYPITTVWSYIKSICVLTLSLFLASLFIGFITGFATGYTLKDIEDKIVQPVEKVIIQTTNDNTASK
jgi:hypothetical protein